MLKHVLKLCIRWDLRQLLYYLRSLNHDLRTLYLIWTLFFLYLCICVIQCDIIRTPEFLDKICFVFGCSVIWILEFIFHRFWFHVIWRWTVTIGIELTRNCNLIRWLIIKRVDKCPVNLIPRHKSSDTHWWLLTC